MTTYQILCLFGISTITGAAWGFLFAKIRKYNSETKAIRLGIQELLKDRLFQFHEYCIEKGFATIDEKNRFESMYEQYHNLGANGVMDKSREEMLDLASEQK